MYNVETQVLSVKSTDPQGVILPLGNSGSWKQFRQLETSLTAEFFISGEVCFAARYNGQTRTMSMETAELGDGRAI